MVKVPQVTVLMAVFNTPPDLLRQAIDSILQQTFTDFEFLILDDGSTAGLTKAVLRKAAQGDRRVRVCREPHRGLTPTLNAGLRYATGEFVARHDADDWSSPTRLELQTAFLSSHPGTAIVGTAAFLHQHDGTPLWVARFPETPEEIDKIFWQCNPFVHGSVMFRRKAALEAGGYREAFRCSQDYDFFWRLSEGGRGANLAAPLYHYRFTGGAISAGKAAEQAIAHECAARLAIARRQGEPENVEQAVQSARRAFPPAAARKAALRQTDHLTLAGEYRAAAAAYLRVLREDPTSLRAWAKLLRLGVFWAFPWAREACFGFRPAIGELSQSRPLIKRANTRVLFVIPGDGQGSSMIFARRQAESLKAEGIAVECFFLLSRTSPRVIASEFGRFRRVLLDFKPDVIHAHYGTVTGLFCALACGRTPLMITYRGSDLNAVPTSGTRALVGRLFSQMAALRARAIVCVSPQLRARLWWRKGRVTVMPSGVDAEQFRPMARFEARQKLGWPQDDRVVIFNAGTDPRNKREDLAVASIEEARKTLPKIRLEVLRGSTDPALMPVMLNAADCLLVTSDSEGSPTVVQEALACALPIVSVDVGDIYQRLDGVIHVKIAPRNPVALAEAIVELTRIPVRTNGREKLPEISLRSIARELQGLYGNLVRA